MITTENNFDIFRIDKNMPTEIPLGRKMIKVRPQTNAVAERMDCYITKAELSLSEDSTQMLVNMSRNRALIPKCLSLIILHSWIKVTLFHWIYWRYLHRRYSMNDMALTLERAQLLSDAGSFFVSTASLQANCRMIQRMSEVNTTITAHEFGQLLKTNASLNSTEE